MRLRAHGRVARRPKMLTYWRVRSAFGPASRLVGYQNCHKNRYPIPLSCSGAMNAYLHLCDEFWIELIPKFIKLTTSRILLNFSPRSSIW